MTPAEYHAAARKLREQRTGDSAQIRFACLASYSLEFLDSFLTVEAGRHDIGLSAEYGPFGQIEQALLAYENCPDQPDLWLIALRIEDQFPDAFFRSRDKNSESLKAMVGQCIDRLRNCVSIIRRSSDAPVLIANFCVPYEQNHSRYFDANCPHGTVSTVETGNAELAALSDELADVAIWDYAGLVRASGSANWTDQRLWQLARQPIAARNRPTAAAHLAQTINALFTPRAKCLVLDLDNTIWGGAAGDDGLEGIQLGDDHPGLAYKTFQRAVLALADQGVLLAACSKNDEEAARSIIESHPEMLIRWDDFVAARINWDDKSKNLIAIADELNIGADSLVLFDDSPVEREEVRINAPAIEVIDVPASPLGYVDALFSCGHFDVSHVSNEDGERRGFYRSEARRRNHSSGFASVEEFLSSLQMNAQLASAGPETLARVTQLIAKTNQFNLTTRRHGQAVIESLAASDLADVRCIRIADRFGDNGIVGVTATRFDGDEATIDTFLMSCRVMNRHVEDAMLYDVVLRAKNRNMKLLHGEYIPTNRNSIVADFYSEHGFRESGPGRESGTIFSIAIEDALDKLDWPATISIEH